MNRHFRIATDQRFNSIGEIQSARKRLCFAALFDHACDTARIAFFTQKIEDASKIAHLQTVHHISSTWPIA